MKIEYRTLCMQTIVEKLRKGLPRTTREELPKSYKKSTAMTHNLKNC